MEEWRDIPGFEGLYSASNTGFVKSLARTVENSHTGYKLSKRTVKERILRHSRSGTICLRKDGKDHYFRIGQLVLYAFVGPPPSKAEQNARHLDDNTEHNYLSNLAWGTHQDNYDDAVRNNRNGPGSPGALARGDKLRGRPRSEVAKTRISLTKQSQAHIERERAKLRARNALGRFS
jgi:hypothetical protein